MFYLCFLILSSLLPSFSPQGSLPLLEGPVKLAAILKVCDHETKSRCDHVGKNMRLGKNYIFFFLYGLIP